MLPNIVDGFTLNCALLYLPNRYYVNALTQMDVLRRAINFRSRWYCIPDDAGVAVAAYDTFQYQVRMTPGSYIWGVNFAVLNGEIGDLLVQVTDSCSEIPLFGDFKFGGGLRSNGTAQLWPVLLSQPRLILEPGLVQAEIANKTSASRTCQLILHVVEPCELVEEDQANPCNIT